MRSCRFLHFETVSTRAPVLSPIPRAHSGAFRPRARPHERRLTRSRSRFSQVFPRRSAKERPSRAFVSRSRRRETNAGENRASRRVSHFDARFGGGAKALSSFVLTTLARLWHPCRLPWRERVGNPTRSPPGPPRSFLRALRERRARFRSRVPCFGRRHEGTPDDFCNASECTGTTACCLVPRSVENGDEPFSTFLEPPLPHDSHRACAFSGDLQKRR